MMNPCVIPEPADDSVGDGRWMSMHNRFVQQAKTSESEVLFLGDSIIQQLQFSTIWTEKISALHCINFGIGGDRVENVLWRIQNGELDFNTKIKAVVLFVGTNNTDCTPHEIFEGILEIIKEIKQRLGNCFIILPTLLPRGQYPNPYRERNDHVNTFLLDKFYNEANADEVTKNVHLVVIDEHIVGNDQTISHHIMHDYLHLTNSGYTKIFINVYEKLCELLKVTPVKYNHDIITDISEFIKNKIPYQPEVLIICGSGIGAICDKFIEPISLNYRDIPNFPVSTVEGHQGRFIFGTLSKVKAVCMQGRFHYYEGYSLQECTIPIKALVLAGLKSLLITNAAGALNPNYKAGDIMLIKDHINFLGLAGTHPLRGPNDSRFGPRFFPMNRAYDRAFITKAKEYIGKLGLADNCHEGVYAMVGGPNYETIAEVKMLRMVGADAVGMSTVPEVLVARHCGIPVFGLSMISNIGISSYEDVTEPNHQEVLDTIGRRTEKLTKLVIDMVGTMSRGS